MNQGQRWKNFLMLWRTIRASNFESAGDLIDYLNEKIQEIKRNP